jgi:hypothetical protein
MKAKFLLISVLTGVLLTACTSGIIETTDTPSPPPPTKEPVVDDQTEDGPKFQDDTPTPLPTTDFRELEIITLLPKDAIPAIDNPTFLSVEEADKLYDPDELVIGVEFNGDARAYSIPFLSGHEIVNDTVGGVALSVTW